MATPSSLAPTERRIEEALELAAIDPLWGNGSSNGDTEVVDRLGVLANEVRLAVILALLGSSDEPLGYAALRDRTALETDNFNYHLDQLVGLYVSRSDAGYTLTPDGRRAGTAVVRGVFGRHPVVESLSGGPEDAVVRFEFPVGSATARAMLDDRLEVVAVELEPVPMIRRPGR